MLCGQRPVVDRLALHNELIIDRHESRTATESRRTIIRTDCRPQRYHGLEEQHSRDTGAKAQGQNQQQCFSPFLLRGQF